MAKRKKKDTVVIICWIEPNATDEIRTLAYHNGKGATRTYLRDEYDPRVDMANGVAGPLPYFDKAGEAVTWMAENRRRRDGEGPWACQLELSAARVLLRKSAGGFADEPAHYERTKRVGHPGLR